MRLQFIISCVVALIIMIGAMGCQTTSQRTQPSAGLTMGASRQKLDGKVGSVQYEAFELESLKITWTAKGMSYSAIIANNEFTLFGGQSQPMGNGLTLIHEASRGKNLADDPDKQLFQTRLKELFAIHRSDIIGISVSMNGKALDL